MMFEYSQMLNTLIRPLLKEESDLGPHLSRSCSRIYVIADCCILSLNLQRFTNVQAFRIFTILPKG